MAEGSYYRSRGKNSWEIRIPMGKNPVTGKYDPYRETFHGTEEECKNRVDDLLYNLRHGKKPKNNNMTIASFLDYFVENFVETQLARSTKRLYKLTIRKHIKPYPISRHKIKDFTPLHIEQHYNLLRTKVTPGILTDVHTVLSSAMRQAYVWDFIEDKFKIDKVQPIPAKERQVLKKQAKKRRVSWKPDQVLDFLEWIRSKGQRRYFIYLIAATIGLRRGENIALKWPNIDFDEKEIELVGSITENRYEEYLKEDYRKVYLFPFLEKELAFYKELQEREKQENSAAYVNEDWVHADKLGSLLMRPDTISHTFQDDIAEFNAERAAQDLPQVPKISFHDLRHTCGSLLFNHFGVPLDVVAEILGHKSGPGFLRQTYIEDDVSAQKNAFDGFDSLLELKDDWNEAATGRNMCTDCRLSDLRIEGSSKRRYCGKYNNWCKAVARSCEGAVK